jgi:hypothetical protein
MALPRGDRSSESPDRPDDPLVAELRTFMLTYGEHDSECPGRNASGPDAVSGAVCGCGFIGRMNELLVQVARRVGP